MRTKDTYRYRIERKARDHPDALVSRAFEFLEHQRVTNHSERTLEAHDYQLARFIAWCDERGVTSALEVTRAVILAFQRWLFYARKENGKPYGFSSQHQALVSVRALFRFLSKNALIPANPAADVELPKVEKRLPKHVLTVAEVEQIFSAIDLDGEMGLRDRAILEVLYSTGMRRAELCTLKLTDLDDERGTVVVRQGKGKKDRTIPIGDRAVAWVRKYVDEERGSLVVEPDEGWLFLTRDGERPSLNLLSRMVHERVAAAELNKRGSCHLFRHTMATLMLEGGADIRFIQEMLGHASVSTTQIYTQVSIRQLKAVHAMAHPAHLESDARKLVDHESDHDAHRAHNAALEDLADLDDEAQEERELAEGE